MKLSISRREQVTSLREAGLSYAEIGRSLGLSKERIRQIYKGISVPLRQKLVQEFDVMLTSGEVARMLGVHLNTVRRWSNRGILKAYIIGPRGDRRFKQRDIESLLARSPR